jgi:hypothetical protein
MNSKKEKVLPVQRCPPEGAFVPLGHLTASEAELLVFQAYFFSDRALGTGTTLVITDAHKALAVNTEEFLTGVHCTNIVAGTWSAGTFGFETCNEICLFFLGFFGNTFHGFFKRIHTSPPCNGKIH